MTDQRLLELMEVQTLPRLVSALRDVELIPAFPGGMDLGNAVFTGCGDSLASAYVAARRGHRAESAGDIEWMEELPARMETLIGISHSGTSGATIRAIRRAREAGLRTVAVTSSPDTPLGESAAEVQAIPALKVQEAIPVAGHIMLSLGVASACGVNVPDACARLADMLERDGQRIIESTVEQLPKQRPESLTVLSLPDLRSGGNFWTLKLMEAVGIAARDVALEESGHVDYFVGPQSNAVIQLVGRAGMTRFERLAEALKANGMPIVRCDLSGIAPGESDDSDLMRELFCAVMGTFIAKAAADLWDRQPFRGYEVNMDASHIKIEY